MRCPVLTVRDLLNGNGGRENAEKSIQKGGEEKTRGGTEKWLANKRNRNVI